MIFFIKFYKTNLVNNSEDIVVLMLVPGFDMFRLFVFRILNKKNPFKFSEVKKRIKFALKKYENKFIIIKIPVVSRVVYGRNVGYKINRIRLPIKIEKIYF